MYLTPITANTEVEFCELAPLTTAVVLFGVNWGGSEAANDIEDWRNFHTKGHAGDLRLSKPLPPALEAIPHETGFVGSGSVYDGRVQTRPHS